MKHLINEKRIAYFYTLIILILFAVPVYFALSQAFEKELILNQLALEKYAGELERSIYTNEIALSQSLKIKYALYDNSGKAILSFLNKEPQAQNFIVHRVSPYLFYKKNVGNNIYGISYIITQIEINYQKLIFIATLVFFIIVINVYIINKIIIKSTARPYEIMQNYMNTFFNDTMHELKTPLGIININVDLLTNKTEANKYTQRIKTALKQIQLTYEDIEYYIKNKNIRYIREKINLSEYVNSRLEFFEDLASAKLIKIELHLSQGVFIFMNPLELQRIIDNTLSNAIKYSQANKTIDVTLSKDEEFAFLTIADQGYGIRDVKFVIQRFSRENLNQGGFGLGLDIVKNICNKNGIKLTIDSKVDVGSTFVYRFSLYKKKLLDHSDDEK